MTLAAAATDALAGEEDKRLSNEAKHVERKEEERLKVDLQHVRDSTERASMLRIEAQDLWGIDPDPGSSAIATWCELEPLRRR